MSNQQKNYIKEEMDMVELHNALRRNIPKNWRIGQFIFNWLEWLGQKGYALSNTIFICKCACITKEEIKNCDCGCHDGWKKIKETISFPRMADPFHLSDNEIIKYWFEYLKEINQPLTPNRGNKDMIDLTKKENWTPELRYVHRTRMIFGFIFGFWVGVLFTRLF